MVHVPLMFVSEWREFPSAPCLAGKKNLMTARVSMLLKSCASPHMLPFSLCNKKRLAIRHMNSPIFPTTPSVPSYDIGKYVGLRTYQHPLVHCGFFVFNYYRKSILMYCCSFTIPTQYPPQMSYCILQWGGAFLVHVFVSHYFSQLFPPYDRL